MSLRDRDGAGEQGQMRRMAKNFVTQRAVQTLLFTLHQTGQRADFDWIEGYMGHQGLSAVHNYGALRCGWRDYLSGMLRLPEQTLTRTVEFYRGGSRGNPFLQPNTREVTQTISPRRLTEWIMELRAEISGEWARDLELIAQENQAHWERHLALLVNNTDIEALQPSVLVAGDKDTALRRANYDLLEKFCTHVACTQVMTELAQNPADEHQAMWFKSFMEDKRLVAHNGARGAGRQFIMDLLNEPPRMMTLSSAGGGGGGGGSSSSSRVQLIDPLDIAARVMAQRQVVAERWQEALAETGEDQLDIWREFMADCLDHLKAVRLGLEKLL